MTEIRALTMFLRAESSEAKSVRCHTNHWLCAQGPQCSQHLFFRTKWRSSSKRFFVNYEYSANFLQNNFYRWYLESKHSSKYNIIVFLNYCLDIRLFFSSIYHHLKKWAYLVFIFKWKLLAHGYVKARLNLFIFVDNFLSLWFSPILYVVSALRK